MLDKLDLAKKVKKEDYDPLLGGMVEQLGELQRQARAKKIPVMIIFEGWSAAGKGRLINELLQALDPRGFTVYSMAEPTAEENSRPFLRRYWVRLPAAGRMAFFDQSWYRRVLTDRVSGKTEEIHWRHAYQQINSFEKQLAESGMLILKFFLHISKEEQKKRFKKIEQDKEATWRLKAEDRWQLEHYRNYTTAIEEMLEKTDAPYAPWALVEAEDKRFAVLKVYSKVIQALQDRIREMDDVSRASVRETVATPLLKTLDSSVLDTVDLSLTVKDDVYKEQLADLQQKMRAIQYALYGRQIPMLVVFEGWDAAGKGGCIRRLTRPLDPRGYDVVPISAPNDVEKEYHYLWRFWKAVPEAGRMAVFDRSWYGRVLVERVEGFCTPDQWKRSYQEINEMEEQFMANGAILIKFWLHIDKDEQLRRFQERKANPYKQWKITDEDWRNREKWDAYKEAVDEMLFRTSTVAAPWTIVEANSKLFTRLKVLGTIVEAAECRLARGE